MRFPALINSLLVWFFLVSAPSHAGDFATREIIGFSSDGSRFAFEEYGIQDGSGFPYSTIYVIDTRSDSWVAGSPFRAWIDDEQASVKEARGEAQEMAKMALIDITREGIINATNQPLEVVDNPHRMTARPWPFNPPTSDRIEFRLKEMEFYDEGLCKDLGGTKGFQLTQVFAEPDAVTKLLHEDTSVPQSRGCPQAYHFADIVTYRPAEGTELVIAVLILYQTYGFEGPDGRYLAVTTRMPVGAN